MNTVTPPAMSGSLPVFFTDREAAKLMRAGFRDCVYQAIELAIILLLFRVPLVKETLEKVMSVNPAAPLLLVGTALFLIGWLVRRFPFYEPGDHARRRRKTLTFLSLGIYCFLLWDFKGEPPMPWFLWIASLALFSVATVGLIEIHQTSQLRRFWRKGARIWLRLVLLIEAGILLAMGLAAANPLLVNLHPAEMFLLLLVGAAFAYIASRQPRREAACSS